MLRIRFLLALVVALLIPSAQAGPPYEFVSPEEERAAVLLVPEGEASGAIAGLTLQWAIRSGYLSLILQNTTPETVEVLWDRSAFVGPDGATVGIIQGSARAADARAAALPVSVVPPGGRIEEDVFRRDDVNISIDGDPSTPGVTVEPMITTRTVGKAIGITLAVRRGDAVTFITSRFRIEADVARLDTLEASRSLADQQARPRRYMRAAAWTGAGAVGGALLFGASAISAAVDPESEPGDAAIMAGMAGAHLAIGLPVSYWFFHKSRKAKAELSANQMPSP